VRPSLRPLAAVAVAAAMLGCSKPSGTGAQPTASGATDASAGLPVPTVSGRPAASAPGPGASPMPVPPPATSNTYPTFRKTSLEMDELGRLVSEAPELARVGTELSFFDPQDGSYVARSTADHQGVVFSAQPLLWSPEPGQQVLVVAARGKSASFVAAWWVLPDGGYRLASTFVMLGEIAPVALAYKPSERGLWWTTCWQCPGETGHVSVREDHHVVIVQD
jgi:hypothetical protein